MNNLNRNILNKLATMIIVVSFVAISMPVQAKKNKNYRAAESYCNRAVQRTPTTKCFVISLAE